MSQENGIPKIEADLDHIIQVKLPVVRDFSTGGGHAPGPDLMEGRGPDAGIVTKKWQGWAPENLNVVGKPLPPMPEVSIPRFLGTAQYATRVWMPDMHYAKVLISPHPRARIRLLDTSTARRMPGVSAILTYENGPANHPLSRDLNFQGEIVAFVTAETEDQAEDALAAIEVDYEILPSASSVRDSMAADAPDLNQGRGNLNQRRPDDFFYDPDASWVGAQGNVEEGFAEADVVREYTYYFAGGVSVPMQPVGGVAKWDGDRLTFWAMNPGIYPYRLELANGLGVELDPRFGDRLPTDVPRTIGPAGPPPMPLAAARINPIPRDDWSDEVRGLLDPDGEGGPVLNLYATLARHPVFFRPRAAQSAYIRLGATLSARAREILILRIGWLCGSEYEWSQHVRAARRIGMSDDEIRRIAEGADAGWDPFEAALIRATDDLHRDDTISDATWQALSERYGTPELIDVVITVAGYRMVSIALNSIGTQLEPDRPRFPDVSR